MNMKFNKKIHIGNFEITSDSPAFIIAEAGVNHNGNINAAKKLIDCAVEAGADAVKFQSFKTENLILKGVAKAPYQQKTTDKDQMQFEMLKRLELDWQQIKMLQECCLKRKIMFLITPFDGDSLEELDSINLPAYKIASTDTTNYPFLLDVAKKGRPIILSTGMSFLSEVESALKIIYPINRDVILLQCTANYPTEDSEANLRVINTFQKRFNILVGYSDHTKGIGASPYAVAMGAKVIEKHFTLDKNQEGPDHKASLSPKELVALVKEIRRVEQFQGKRIKKPTVSECATRKSLQKCFVAKGDIAKGEIFGKNNIIAKRTNGVGISPVKYKDIYGKKSNRDYLKDEIIES